MLEKFKVSFPASLTTPTDQKRINLFVFLQICLTLSCMWFCVMCQQILGSCITNPQCHRRRHTDRTATIYTIIKPERLKILVIICLQSNNTYSYYSTVYFVCFCGFGQFGRIYNVALNRHILIIRQGVSYYQKC